MKVLLPVVGVVAEGVRSSFGKWVNVGYPLAAASLWLAEAARWRHDPFFGVPLIIGAGILTLAGLSHVVYQRTKAADRTGGAGLH